MPEFRSAIVGIHEYPDRFAPGKSPMQIKAQCAARALADAGLGWADVDALYDAGEGAGSGEGPWMAGLTVAEYLGLRPSLIDTTGVGGSAFEFHVSHARDAIRSGRVKVALLTYGSTTRSEGLALGTGSPYSNARLTPSANMERPWGMSIVASYALAANRHMHQYGTTSEQLAEIAVSTRAHAMRNPEAVKAMTDLRFRDIGELSIDDVVSSRMVADPLHRLDCCMISDGGGALVIAAEDVVRDCRSRPVWIVGAAEAIEYVGNDSDITVTAAAQSGPRALAEAGLTPQDIDVLMVYDSFTITVMLCLEGLGFCSRGDGGEFVSGGRLRWDTPGGLALNTDGGGLFSNHPGMRGIFLLIEASRQLRGESTSQVAGARYAMAHGNGGRLGGSHTGGTVVLSNA